MSNEEFQSQLEKVLHEQNQHNYSLANELCTSLVSDVEHLLQTEQYEKRIDVIVMNAQAFALMSEILLHQGNPNESLVFSLKSLTYAEESGNKRRIALTLNFIGKIYAELSEYELALEFYTKAIAFYKELGDRLNEAYSIGNIGILHQNHADYAKAKEHYLLALETYKELGSKGDIAVVYVNLGLVYQNTSEFLKALETYSKALETFEELGNQVAISIVTGNIGIVFDHFLDYDRALEYLNKSLEIKERLGMESSVALVRGNIGNIYIKLKNYPLALEYLSKAQAVHEEIGKKMEAALWTASMAKIYFELEEYNIALEFLLKALAVHEQLGRKAEIARLTGDIGLIYAEKKFDGYNRTKAEEYLLQAISMHEELGVKHHLGSVCKSLSELYENQERWKESIAYYKKYHELEKEVLSEESKKQADKFAYEQQISDQEKRIAVEQARNEEILRQQQILEQQAAKIQLKNTELQEINIKLDSANYQLTEQAANIQLKNTELHEKNIELNLANRQLEEAGKFKMKILGIASHDLKNPITGINMTAEMLIKYASLQPDVVKKLQMIMSTSKRMLDIVVNLMDVSARELGEIKISRSTFNIGALIEEITNEYQSRALEKKQTLEFHSEGNCVITADEFCLRQVFDNLISNAVKYTEKEKEIRVSVIATKETIRIAIADQGQGLSEEDKSLMFKDFQKLSARPTGGEGSTGLGLSVVKNLVELHGGKVWAESQGKGMGSTFYVELPV